MDDSNNAKLITISTNCSKSDFIINQIRQAGGCGCTKVFAKKCFFSGEKFVCEPQCVFVSIIRTDYSPVIKGLKEASVDNPDFEASVLLLDVLNFKKHSAGVVNNEITEDISLRSVDMEQKNNLIVTIVNRGHNEEIMTAARKAGAQGGTVVEAKGTGTEEDAIFFGIRLAPEKEMILILADDETLADIVESIKSRPIFCERGSGIIFTMKAEQAFFFNKKHLQNPNN